MMLRESAHQCAFVQRCRLHPLARLTYSIPNGGARGAAEAVRLKREGVVAGMPDMHLPVGIGRATGLYIEFKHGSGRLSPQQGLAIAELVKVGHVVIVAYTWELAWEWTEKYLSGLLDPGMIVLKPSCPRSTNGRASSCSP